MQELRRISYTVVGITIAIALLFIITINKAHYIVSEKYNLAAYGKLGVIKLSEKYEEELKKWPLLYLDKDFRDVLLTLRKTSGIVQKNQINKLKNAKLTPTPTKTH